MDLLVWLIIVIAVVLVVGGITTAWRAFSRVPRVRSPEMRQLDELYFDGKISRDDYLRRKEALERKERGEAGSSR